MKRWAWTLGLVGLAVLVWWMARPKPLAVDLAPIERGTARALVVEEARTRVVDTYLISAPVDGRLRRVDLVAGDSVTAGQVVAEIDPLPIQSRVDDLEAQLRALDRRIEGVSTKTPKPEEIQRALVLEESARRTLEAAQREEAELAAARDEAESAWERERSLGRKGAAAGATLDAARSAAEQARQRLLAHQARLKYFELQISVAALERAVLESRQQDYAWEESVYREQMAGLRANLRSITADLARTTIIAPAAGTVLTIHRESEQFVAAGAPILEIGDLSRLEVEADFLSEDAAHMREGMDAEVFGRALGDRTIRGRVLRVEPRAFEKISSLGVEQQRVNVIIAIDATDTGLRDRFRVEARVIVDVREGVLLVPEGALFRDAGEWHVFRVRNGRARRVRVETGIRDSRRREMVSGLDEGDAVVLYPSATIADGDRVTPLPDRE